MHLSVIVTIFITTTCGACFLLAQKNLHLNKAFVQNRKGIIKNYTMKLKNNKNHNYRQQKQGFFVLTIS